MVNEEMTNNKGGDKTCFVQVINSKDNGHIEEMYLLFKNTDKEKISVEINWDLCNAKDSVNDVIFPNNITYYMVACTYWRDGDEDLCVYRIRGDKFEDMEKCKFYRHINKKSDNYQSEKNKFYKYIERIEQQYRYNYKIKS